MKKRQRNWVLHDYLQVNGGAERLVITLARGLTGFRLGVSGIYSGFSGTGRAVNCEVISGATALLPRIPRALLAFGDSPKFIRQADQVIFSGLYAPLAAVKQPTGKQIYYCHTPPRFAFDLRQEYLQRASSCMRPVLKLAIGHYRQAYLDSLRYMDKIIVNSNHVRTRLLELTGMESQVIYPPIATRSFQYRGDDGYYLSVARLEPAKRVERIVQAFIGLPERTLVVASGGSQLKKLMTLANGATNIRFTGWVNDETLVELIGRATAVIYIPADEDFGMSAVEAMAAGKPVIGVAAGGLPESIIDGATGILLDADPSPGDVAAAVRQLNSGAVNLMRAACERRAATFSEDRFLTSFRSLLAEA